MDVEEFRDSVSKRNIVEHRSQLKRRPMADSFERVELMDQADGKGPSFYGPGETERNDPEVWELYAEELIEQAMARTDFDDPDLGIALLSIKSGARGNAKHLRWWIGALGNVTTLAGDRVPARETLSEGKVEATLYAEVFGAHRGMTRIPEGTADFGKEFRDARFPKGFNVIARAIRTTESGIVFARAAAIEEVDPLRDVDSRMLAGLRPEGYN